MKPLGYQPQGFIFSSLLFIGLGLGADIVRTRQNDFIQRRMDRLLEERQARGNEFKRYI
jgi:hypothetical protein